MPAGQAVAVVVDLDIAANVNIALRIARPPQVGAQIPASLGARGRRRGGQEREGEEIERCQEREGEEIERWAAIVARN